MLRHNDWMTYSYDGKTQGQKTEKNQKLSLHIKCCKPLVLEYTEALFRNARVIQDTYNLTQDVLLSGGIDSEIIVRVNKTLGIKQNLYTFRLSDNLNYKDVDKAISLAAALNLKLNIINFDVKKFIETEAEALYKKTYMSLPYSIRNKWIEHLDNLPVFGNAEQYWMRILDRDYSRKSEWQHTWFESEFENGIYGNIINRLVIGEWYLYTPEPFFNYHNNKIIKSLLNDEISGKTSTWSSRHLVYKDIWPDIEYKQKLTGYEGTGAPGSRPIYIDKFEQEVMGGFSHRYIHVRESDFDSLFSHDMTFTTEYAN